jgi:hypothetical protein
MRPANEDLLQERVVNKGLNNSRKEGEWLLAVNATEPAESGKDEPLLV